MAAMIALLAALGAAVAVWNPVPMVANVYLAQARDRWLWSLLALSVGWLALGGHYWLALMGLWFLIAWARKGHEVLEHLVPWIAIGATWFFFRSIPNWAWTYLSWVWVAGAVWQSWLCVKAYREVEWPKDNRPRLGNRTKGSLGSPVLTAICMATTFPLVSTWLLPLLLPGLYLTFSFTCLLGVTIAVAWLYPPLAIYAFCGLMLPLALMLLAKRHEVDVVGKANWRNQRLFEFSPRGDSTDGWVARLILDRLVVTHVWKQRAWLGLGPGTLQTHARRWGSQGDQELLSGEVHCDAIQHVAEFGVLGALSILAFVVPIAMNLRLGDSWSAAWVVMVVISFVHWPCRHVSLGLMFLAISARLA